MKKYLSALPLVIMLSFNSQASHAGQEFSEKKGLTVAATSAVGGLIGGPIGFVVAGVGGALLADAVFEKNEEKENSVSSNLALNQDSELSVEIASTEESVDQSVTNDEYSLNSSFGHTTENTTTSISQDFLFATNADFIDQEIASDLDAFVSVLEKHPKSLIKVDGYADPRGEDNYNLELSTRRAEAVTDYLVEKGIERERIMIRSFGESKSIASIDDLNAHEKERRVTIQLDESMLTDENEVTGDTLAKIN